MIRWRPSVAYVLDGNQYVGESQLIAIILPFGRLVLGMGNIVARELGNVMRWGGGDDREEMDGIYL